MYVTLQEEPAWVLSSWVKRRPLPWIDLFSLYVLFSHDRSCDNTLENCFFQILSYSHASSMHDLWKDKGSSSPGTSTAYGKTKHYKLKRSTVSSIGGRLSPTSGIVNLVFSCQNDFLSASIRSLIIKALVITESALPSLLRPGFETVPLQESCTTNWLIVQYYSWDLHLNIFHTIYFT